MTTLKDVSDKICEVGDLTRMIAELMDDRKQVEKDLTVMLNQMGGRFQTDWGETAQILNGELIINGKKKRV